ncbi:MAG: hypothetical protein KBD00_01220 [Candidatus Peribacteraceae bacterium]|nr:hypothetical protein [Candidatus Peribacteraceae bacterium]
MSPLTFSLIKKNWSILLLGSVMLCFTVLLGVLFYTNAKTTVEKQVSERIRSIASTAAITIDGTQLDTIHGLSDIEKPIYRESVLQLQKIRDANPGVVYAYILRPTADPTIYEFIADADSLDPYATVDTNKDGKIDDADSTSPPGTSYDVTKISNINRALTEPVITDHPYTDKWGTFMSGFAPVRNASGAAIGIIGIDMKFDDYSTLAHSIVSPTTIILFLLAAGLLTSYVLLFAWKRRAEAWERIDRERSSLLSITSHQLGTPVTIVRWSLDTLEKSASKEEHQYALNNAREGLERINDILKSLHDADMVSRGTVTITPTLVNVKTILDTLVKATSTRLQKTQQKLILDLPEDFSLEIDSKLASQILEELITNASHFSGPHTRIHMRVVKENSTALCVIQDDGSGIPTKDMEHIGEKYFRASNAAILHPDGNGLGMYMAKRLTEQAGGSIHLDSELGKGTTVTVRIPLKALAQKK